MLDVTTDLTVFFVHSGSTCVKVVRRALMELGPGVKFINILLAPFSYKSALLSFSLILQFGFVIFWQNDIGAIAAHQMLMKLTTGVNQPKQIRVNEESPINICNFLFQQSSGNCLKCFALPSVSKKFNHNYNSIFKSFV